MFACRVLVRKEPTSKQDKLFTRKLTHLLITRGITHSTPLPSGEGKGEGPVGGPLGSALGGPLGGCYAILFYYDIRHAGLYRRPNLHLSRIQSEYMALVDGDYYACHLYVCLLRGRTICRLWNADILYLSSHLWLLVLEVRTEERGRGDSYHTLSSSVDTPFTACLPPSLGRTLYPPHQVHELYRTGIR